MSLAGLIFGINSDSSGAEGSIKYLESLSAVETKKMQARYGHLAERIQIASEKAFTGFETAQRAARPSDDSGGIERCGPGALRGRSGEYPCREWRKSTLHVELSRWTGGPLTVEVN